ncbi:flavodoxin domain-containing protein [Phenylobacterium sp.]|uniref:flavodoxin domain-containing protein n=1 Tax=Phenylobacterium sp. TaxID=1871053 RepID=UPI002E37147F|nr:flavodoxin domain-containing protein [Phenylobacterium sp.]HEX4709265.1 flavodoxin domain-containing protein [Phenylobacterium sp.]
MRQPPGAIGVGEPDFGPARSGRVALKDRFQQVIITIHRWLGVLACILFVMWFVSGLVLAYVRFPAMSLEDRLAVLKPIDWRQVQVTPEAALGRLGLSEFPQELRLEMSGGEPVYRVTDWAKHHRTVSAATGRAIGQVSGEDAVRIVREQLNAPAATLAKRDLDRDQWTVTGYWNADRPFHLIHLNDKKGTQDYVSTATGEIVLETRRYQRVWNWFGAIPHWLYFETLRRSTPAWSWTIYILASAGIFVAVSGLWIGFSRLRLRLRYANGRATPFSGWMKWHHISGVLGGVFLTLWVVSGLFTMYPGGVLETRSIQRAERNAYAGGAGPSFSWPGSAALEAAGLGARRATFRWVGGRSLIALEDGVGKPRLVDAATGQVATLTTAQIVEAARAIMPGAHVAAATLLTQGDEYWHSGFYKKKLPVVRVAFDDPAATWFHFDAETGALLGLMDKTSRVDRWTVVAVHDLDWNWLLQRRPWWDAFLFGVTLPGLLISVTALTIGYRRLQRTGLAPAPGGGAALLERLGRPDPKTHDRQPAVVRSDLVLVAYASQTGTAKGLADKTAGSLENAGQRTVLRDLGQVDARLLAEVGRAIFIVATAGDGDAPDLAMAFERRVLRRSLSLHGLEYGMLALGDRQYRAFCGFGLTVDNWLQACGARQLFATIQMHDLDSQALARWSRALESLTGRPEDLAVERAAFEPWRLVDRRHLNPGSAGWPIFHLEFEPRSGGAAWESGDIVQLPAATWSEHETGVGDARLREFSIASAPDDGRIHLLVRQVRDSSGELGAASSVLTQRAAIGDEIPLRLRSNIGFHPPADDRPILLIGNGAGLAGLRSHIRRRVRLGHRRNWLIFGERNAAADSLHGDELAALHAAGGLERLDLVFSRDQAERRYVQHRMAECADDLRAWIARGAVVYVCGSVDGMAPAVTDTLAGILGETAFDELVGRGDYRRDVY